MLVHQDSDRMSEARTSDLSSWSKILSYDSSTTVCCQVFAFYYAVRQPNLTHL